MTDWQRLLKKYMAFVLEEEGISFVHHIDDGWRPSPAPQFESGEVAELREIEHQIFEDTKRDLRP